MNFDEFIAKLKGFGTTHDCSQKDCSCFHTEMEDQNCWVIPKKEIHKLVEEYKASNDSHGSEDSIRQTDCEIDTESMAPKANSHGSSAVGVHESMAPKASDKTIGIVDNLNDERVATLKGSDNAEVYDGICIHGNFGNYCEDCKTTDNAECKNVCDCGHYLGSHRYVGRNGKESFSSCRIKDCDCIKFEGSEKKCKNFVPEWNRYCGQIENLKHSDHIIKCPECEGSESK